jgi:hypothetical protein
MYDPYPTVRQVSRSFKKRPLSVVVAHGMAGVVCSAREVAEGGFFIPAIIEEFLYLRIRLTYLRMTLDLKNYKHFELEQVTNFCVVTLAIFSSGMSNKGAPREFTDVKSSWKLFCHSKLFK